jgi:ABC-type glycerol-3-phosphate transport system substrate-binding protein
MKGFPRLIPVLVFLVHLVFPGCTIQDWEEAEQNTVFPDEVRTIKIVSPSGRSVRAIYEVAERFSREHPGFTVGVSVISGSVPMNTFLTSKFAVGDVPDLLIYQAGGSTALFAQGGHLAALDGEFPKGYFIPDADRYCRYRNNLYALPLDITVSGLFVQMSVLWRGAVLNHDNRVVPKTFDEFIYSCERLRQAGIEYPVVISAASEIAAGHFPYQFIQQNIYNEDPSLYDPLLNGRGELKWTDPPFREMYAAYGAVRRYMNPDAVRIDEREAIRRFANGEAAYLIGTSRDIAAIREIQPTNLDMLLVTPPWTRDLSRASPLLGLDTVISVSAATAYPEEARAFLRDFVSAEGADLYTQAVGSISAVRESFLWYDPCLGPYGDVFRGRNITEFFPRQWPPGFDTLFRRFNREWFTSRSVDSTLEGMESQRQRLMLMERTGP